MTMPEERFHAQFGEDFCTDLMATKDGHAQVQAALDKVFPSMPAFFGRPNSKNNEIFRRWQIKLRTNEEMRDDYMRRVRELVEGKLGLKLPDVKLEAA
jgi:ring-1,2-phenylacetyl-CoA epoxidase subunit PaaA